MIRNLKPGDTVWFVGDVFLRKGRLLDIAGNTAAIRCGQMIEKQPTARCFNNEADAERFRADRLQEDIAVRQQSLAASLHRLAELGQPTPQVAAVEADGQRVELCACAAQCGRCC